MYAHSADLAQHLPSSYEELVAPFDSQGQPLPLGAEARLPGRRPFPGREPSTAPPPATLRDGKAIRSWLMRVATNLAIDRMRRKQPLIVEEVPDIADDGIQADGALARSQIAGNIDAAIAGLPDRQRIALVMTYFEHMSNQQTAEVLNLSVDAVESLLSRARRNLKSQIAGEWRDMLDELADR